MIYHTIYERWNNDCDMTSGVKGMNDISDIMEKCGVQNIHIPSIRRRHRLGIIERARMQNKILRSWLDACDILCARDVLMIDLPLHEKFAFLGKLVRHLKHKQIHVVFFAADLELARNDTYSGIKKWYVMRSERYCIRHADALIAHNDIYKDLLIRNGATCPIITFGIFDYIITEEERVFLRDTKRIKDGAVIIAGNLKPPKSEYIHKLPENCYFNIYGPNYDESKNKNVSYKGAFNPDDLIYHLEGSYGLIWDGSSSESCVGAYGEYLKINTPHKLSLYLACGIPVIIWRHAAAADFVEKHRCGFTISNLEDIPRIRASISEEEYAEMSKNSQKIGEDLTKGLRTKSVISELSELFGQFP